MDPRFPRVAAGLGRLLVPVLWLAFPVLLVTGGHRDALAAASRFFVIQVIDEQTGRGVPLVLLETVNKIPFWTDSLGRIAFEEPGLMGRETFFHVHSDGYEYPADGFGFRGVRLTPRAGREATIRLQRTNIAERLYRITGQGIYRDTVLAGLPAPLREPVLNGQVMGQDTVIATPYRGKIYWFWGDTDRVGYPLGNFGAAGATSEWPGKGGLDPSLGIDLTYFTDRDGFARPMCPIPDQHLRWIESVFTLPDENGQERLYARLAHHRDLGPAVGWYLLRFDDERGQFEPLETWARNEGHDSAHPFRARVNGVEYLYFYPNWRVPANLPSVRDPGRYEAYTCVAGDGRIRETETAIDRDAQGRPRYAWKAGADRLHPGRLRQLREGGRLGDGEAWLDLRDVETGDRIEAGRGSVFWNPYRGRWILLTSARPGEIWFAEADTPTGPWAYARRVVSHRAYNFYNPTQHPFFDQDGGRLVYFEGTYTASFSAATGKTPRYEYNQVLYRLTLDDPRLTLPVPVYRFRAPDGRIRHGLRAEVMAEDAWSRIEAVPFFALPPTAHLPDSLPVYGVTGPNGVESLVVGSAESHPSGRTPRFRIVSASPGSGKTTSSLSNMSAAHLSTAAQVDLGEWRHPDGRRHYTTDPTPASDGFEPVTTPLGRVWVNSKRVLTLDVPVEAIGVTPSPSRPPRARRGAGG